MDSVIQSKDIGEKTGLKNKTQPYVAYKRLISLKKRKKTHWLRVKGWKKVFQVNELHE
jgi:hypothetical protein